MAGRSLGWKASDQRKKRRVALDKSAAHPLPVDEERAAQAIRMDKWHRGERGYSTRGAQGHDAYARRNYTKVTLPKVKFLEGE